MRRSAAVLAVVALGAPAACGGEAGPDLPDTIPRSVTLTSPAFAEGAPIPARYTCEDQNVAPPLRWSGLPAETRSIALVMVDLDAPGGRFTHWTLWDIPATSKGLAEGLAPQTVETGENSFGRTGYGGPCPPSGTHRYVLTLYALREELPIEAGASIGVVDDALGPRTIATGELTGTFAKG